MTQATAPVLLFPTHYLGNFVLGIPWIAQIVRSDPNSLVVLDSCFQPLAEMILPPETQILYYPRAQLASSQPFFSRLKHYVTFLKALRSRKKSTLLDLEGERFTGVLSLLSGCHQRVGPTGKRAERFYTRVLDLDYYRHRYNAFGEVCAEFTGGVTPSSNLQYAVDKALRESVADKIAIDPKARPCVAIHPGASVEYKLWSRDYFIRLQALLEEAGLQVLWVGAGTMDTAIIADIQERSPNARSVSLCGQLNFAELVALFHECHCFIGSDSGPMHLAASTGTPVFALFGPSKEAIWAPLGDNSQVLRGSKPCGEQCDAFACDYNYQCLESLLPEQVIQAMTARSLLPASDKVVS